MKDKIIAKQDELIKSFINRLNYNYSDIDLWSKMNTKLRSELAALEQESKEQKIKDKCSKIYDKVKEAITPDKRTFEQAEKESKEQPPDGNYDVHVKMNTKKVMKGKLVMDKEQSAEELGDGLCEYCPSDKKGVYSVPGGFMAGCEGSHCEDAMDNYLISELSASQKLATINNMEVSASQLKDQSAESAKEYLEQTTVWKKIGGGNLAKQVLIEFAEGYFQQSRREDLIKYEIAQNTVGGKLHGSKERIIECIDKYLNPKP